MYNEIQRNVFIGVLTERDIVYRVLAQGGNITTTQVHEAMSRDVVVVKPSLTVHDAMQVVTEKRFRHLPVVSGGHLIGVVSSAKTRWLLKSARNFMQGPISAVSVSSSKTVRLVN